MSTRRRARALLLVTGPLGRTLAGPEIRALEFAHALRHDYEVTLVAQRRDATVRDGLRVLPARRALILRVAAREQLILSAALPPYLLPLRRACGFTVVADEYDPYERELATLADRPHQRELRRRAAVKALQLSQADLVLCAGERQRAALIEAARALRVGRRALRIDPVVIPFGLSAAPAASGRRPLHAEFAQLEDGDTIVLWWGALWRWLDAERLIDAFAHIAGVRRDVKLVLTAGPPPNANNARFLAVRAAARRAAALGLLGSSVLLLERWIPYTERYDYLREATLGVTLHRSAPEAELAVRSRYLDYLSVALPCLLDGGDELAGEFAAAGYATLVEHRDPAALARQILALVADPAALARQRAAGRRLAQAHAWSNVGERLRAALTQVVPPAGRRPSGRPSAGRRAGSLSAELALTLSYYGRAVSDRLSEPSPWKHPAASSVE